MMYNKAVARVVVLVGRDPAWYEWIPPSVFKIRSVTFSTSVAISGFANGSVFSHFAPKASLHSDDFSFGNPVQPPCKISLLLSGGDGTPREMLIEGLVPR